MFLKLRKKIRDKVDKKVCGVGQEVYWNNPSDSVYTGYFSGYYTILTRPDKSGYIKIYNEDKGERTVPYYYVDTVEDTKLRRERENILKTKL